MPVWELRSPDPFFYKKINTQIFAEMYCAVVVNKPWLICSALGLHVSWDRWGCEWETLGWNLALVCPHGWDVGQRHCTLITSIPEDTPGPSSAVCDQEEEPGAAAAAAPEPRRRRDREDEFLDLIREDMGLQRRGEHKREWTGCFLFLKEWLRNMYIL